MELKFEDLPHAIAQLIDQNSLILTRIQEAVASDLGNEEILTLGRICELLELKRQTIYSYVSKGKIPFHKRAGKLYFFRQEIKEWLKGETKDSLVEGISFNPKRKFRGRGFKN
ncbi:helix-turn-helix domain-containing protein [Algoriphagus yeomjeoni]|uniref:AlpA family transcriptional regulator n=1 Tax=Algoriphagus yeomjeoni TaxID=291403 RepID=A0A327P8C9_9BACT|nr:helix-turn-helix domain-containing protein [Algoriphagus yeomjeoni]RAI88510.1 AlpA family transcriptional regulator [Algoriphagus yeomjeoni]